MYLPCVSSAPTGQTWEGNLSMGWASHSEVTRWCCRCDSEGGCCSSNGGVMWWQRNCFHHIWRHKSKSVSHGVMSTHSELLMRCQVVGARPRVMNVFSVLRTGSSCDFDLFMDDLLRSFANLWSGYRNYNYNLIICLFFQQPINQWMYCWSNYLFR